MLARCPQELAHCPQELGFEFGLLMAWARSFAETTKARAIDLHVGLRGGREELLTHPRGFVVLSLLHQALGKPVE